MNRLSCVAVLLTVALGVLLPVAPVPALADQIGGVIVIPSSGSDLTAIRVRTSAGCPAKADAYIARMKGHGFPPDGEIVTSTISAGMSHSIGFDVYFAVTMSDFAQLNHTTLSGRYDITVLCIDSFTTQSYGEFTGSLQFTSPTHYEALGTAKPTGSPPPPLALAGDGSAVAPAAAPPPAGRPSVAGPPTSAAHGQPPSPTTGQPVPGGDPQPQSPSGQLTSQRNDVTGQSVPWLVLVMIGAALVTVVTVAANRIRKRRSS
ncbi:MAG: hypothetical protein DLM61_05070 [Pseudonocardiales bacterium]|nr:MAG: hypothetical protein DLM61_05070 [Pseudonocardiales bacterium]